MIRIRLEQEGNLVGYGTVPAVPRQGDRLRTKGRDFKVLGVYWEIPDNGELQVTLVLKEYKL